MSHVIHYILHVMYRTAFKDCRFLMFVGTPHTETNRPEQVYHCSHLTVGSRRKAGLLGLKG